MCLFLDSGSRVGYNCSVYLVELGLSDHCIIFRTHDLFNTSGLGPQHISG